MPADPVDIAALVEEGRRVHAEHDAAAGIAEQAWDVPEAATAYRHAKAALLDWSITSMPALLSAAAESVELRAEIERLVLDGNRLRDEAVATAVATYKQYASDMGDSRHEMEARADRAEADNARLREEVERLRDRLRDIVPARHSRAVETNDFDRGYTAGWSSACVAVRNKANESLTPDTAGGGEVRT